MTVRSFPAQQHGLSAKVLESLQQVLAAHPEVEQAILHGSRAMGTFEPASEIDLTLVGAGLTNQCLACIEADLDDLLLPYLIDLSALASINHALLRDHIERVGIVLYQKRSAANQGRESRTGNCGQQPRLRERHLVQGISGCSQPPSWILSCLFMAEK